MSIETGKRYLYERISDVLRERIGGGDLPSGRFLPGEHSLCVEFETTRVTVRRALKALQVEGVIENRPGKGWLVLGRGEDGYGKPMKRLRTVFVGFSAGHALRVQEGFMSQAGEYGYACEPVSIAHEDFGLFSAGEISDADALVYFSPKGMAEEHSGLIRSLGVPCVSCAGSEHCGFDTVVPDWGRRVEAAHHYLRSEGCSRVLFLTCDPGKICDASFAKLPAAFVGQCMANKLDYEVHFVPFNTLISYPADELHEIEKNFLGLFSGRTAPDGVLTIGDGLARQAAALLARNGMLRRGEVKFASIDSNDPEHSRGNGEKVTVLAPDNTWLLVGKRAAAAAVSRAAGVGGPPCMMLVDPFPGEKFAFGAFGKK